MLKHPKSLERGFIRLVVTVALVALGAPQRALATPIINFETLPSLPAQPNNFVAAGPMQTYSSFGLFSISGGVVLGNPMGLAGFASQGSRPNAYGPTDARQSAVSAVPIGNHWGDSGGTPASKDEEIRAEMGNSL